MEEARSKIKKFCAYQERSQREVRNKLRGYNIPEEWVEDILVELMEEDFLNEWRFAQLYAKSKLNQNGWGRYKIQSGLHAKGVPESIINYALRSMEEEAYQKILDQWIRSKSQEYTQDLDPKKAKFKTIRFCQYKGFQYDEIKLRWDQIFGKKDN